MSERIESHAGAMHFCTIAKQERLVPPRSRGLVVGSGRGHEAAYLCRALDAKVVAIDLDPRLPPGVEPSDDLVATRGDVLNLAFPDAAFDFVFYHHVIEHVSDPARSVVEIARVLKDGGVLHVGTPNRNRIVGYVGSFEATRREKLVWNLFDYRARLRGRFRNELGAHAGFTRAELCALLTPHFGEIRWLTESYLRFKYASRLPKQVLAVLSSRPFVGFAAPSLYALCRK